MNGDVMVVLISVGMGLLMFVGVFSTVKIRRVGGERSE